MASNEADYGSKCPICFEIYKDPKALSCLHTFCEICIHEYILKSKERDLLCDGIECPLCRNVTPIENNTSPETWAKSLQTNVALASLFDSPLVTQESIKLEENDCQPCLMQNITSTASVLCSLCNEKMCESCKMVHKSFQLTRNHEFVEIDCQENVEFSKILNKYQKCEQHGKKIKFYCKDEDKLCCSTCAIVTHRACQGLVEISAITKDAEVQLQGSLLRKQISEMENTMKLSSTHLVAEHKQINTKTAELLTEWNQVKKKVDERLDRFENVIKEKIKAIQTTELSAINVNAEKCNGIEEEMRRLQSILELSYKNCTQEQQYVVMKKIHDEFSVRQSESEQSFGEIKSLNFSLILPQTLNDLLCMSEEGVSVAVESSAKHIPKCAPKTLSLLSEIHLEKADGDDAVPYFRGLGFLSDERVVAVDNRNKKCILMDNKLNKLVEICLPVTPQSLVVTDDDYVKITTGLEKKLLIYRVSEGNHFNEVAIIPVSLKCDSISIVDNNKCVVSTYGGDVEPVHFLNFNGEFTRLMCDFGGKCYEKLKQFKSVYNVQKMELLITDYDENKVHVYSFKETQALKVEYSDIPNPRGIACYLNDLYFICSCDTNSIVQLSSKGGILQIDRLDELKNPRSVCIAPNKDKLVVSNNLSDEGKLVLFEIN